MTARLIACGLSDETDAAELSEADTSELQRFGAYLKAAMVRGQNEAYELVYGESVPKPMGDA